MFADGRHGLGRLLANICKDLIARLEKRAGTKGWGIDVQAVNLCRCAGNDQETEHRLVLVHVWGGENCGPVKSVESSGINKPGKEKKKPNVGCRVDEEGVKEYANLR